MLENVPDYMFREGGTAGYEIEAEIKYINARHDYEC